MLKKWGWGGWDDPLGRATRGRIPIVPHMRTTETGLARRLKVEGRGSKFRKLQPSAFGPRTLARFALLTRRWVFRIDDLRRIGVQLSKPINQRLRGRRALVGRLTHRVVPGEGVNAGVRQ